MARYQTKVFLTQYQNKITKDIHQKTISIKNIT